MFKKLFKYFLLVVLTIALNSLYDAYIQSKHIRHNLTSSLNNVFLPSEAMASNQMDNYADAKKSKKELKNCLSWCDKKFKTDKASLHACYAGCKKKAEEEQEKK